MSITITNHPDTADLALLLAVRDPICVSLIAGTVPAERMRDADRYVVFAHAMDAVRRLEQEPDQGASTEIAMRLMMALEEVVAGPTDRALAVFVSATTTSVFHLPVAVESRVVVDPTFATRDLVRTLEQNPEFLMLAVDEEVACLYHYNHKYLAPQLSAEFPLLRGSADLQSYLAMIDRALGRVVRADRLPLVLVATDQVVDRFLTTAHNAFAVSGVVARSPKGQRLSGLEQWGRTAMREHVLDLQAAAGDTMSARLRSGRAVTGLLACWHAVQRDQPEILLVEDGFELPARPVFDGGFLEPVADREELGVYDDALDELIEQVLAKGGFVSVVPPGTLAQHGRVAVSVREALAAAG